MMSHFMMIRAMSFSDQCQTAISDSEKDELQKVLSEADKKGRGDILRNVWKLDVEERLKFQKQNGNFK